MQNSHKLLYFVIAGVATFFLIIIGFLTATRSFQTTNNTDTFPSTPPLATASPSTQTTSGMRFLGEECKTGGCSNTVCLDETAEDAITTCEYKNEYACYKSAVCEKQANGRCGWTQTSELSACLANPPQESPGDTEVSL